MVLAFHLADTWEGQPAPVLLAVLAVQVDLEVQVAQAVEEDNYIACVNY